MAGRRDWHRNTEGWQPEVKILRRITPHTSYKSRRRKIPPGPSETGEDERRTGMNTPVTTRLVQRTLSGGKDNSTCHCGKVRKNARGIRIHQVRTGCRSGVQQQQRTGKGNLVRRRRTLVRDTTIVLRISKLMRHLRKTTLCSKAADSSTTRHPAKAIQDSMVSDEQFSLAGLR